MIASANDVDCGPVEIPHPLILLEHAACDGTKDATSALGTAVLIAGVAALVATLAVNAKAPAKKAEKAPAKVDPVRPLASPTYMPESP